MREFVPRVRRFTVFVLSFLLLLYTTVPVYAVGPTGPVGPQVPTGPQVKTGPTCPAGPEAMACLEALQQQQASNPSTGDSSTTASNSDTGANSSNQNQITNSTDTSVSNTNNSAVNNDADVNASSGNNTVVGNTSAGDVETGNITGSVDMVNVQNSQFGAGSSVGSQSLSGSSNPLTLNSPTNRSLLTNGTTGANSANSNSVSNASSASLLQGNNALANNVLNVNADTGNNTIAYNTGVGAVTTGNILLGLNSINLQNLNWGDTQLMLDVYNIFGDQGDIIIPELANTSTGALSSNTNDINNARNTSVTATNNADINNMLNIEATTGNNTVEGNTQSGNLTTGDTNVNGSITNVANIMQPVLYIVNVIGEWVGGLASLVGLGNNVIVNQVNDTTGYNSANSNDTNNTQNTTITQDNNASATTKFNVKANTGGNTVGYNTQAGDIKTGSVNVAANILNFANSSLAAGLGKLKIGVINIFGKFTGTIKKEADKTVASTSQGGATQTKTQTLQSTKSTTTSNGDTKNMKVAIKPEDDKNSDVSAVSKAKSLIKKSLSSSEETNISQTSKESGADSLTASAAGDNVLVKSYTQIPATKHSLPKQLIGALLVGILLIGGWGMTEYIAYKQKRKSI
jgi:hypothetical protein